MQAVASDIVTLEDNSVSEPDFAALFQQFYPNIYNYLRYRVNSVEDAEDLIGTVFERAFANRRKRALPSGYGSCKFPSSRRLSGRCRSRR